ncbi:MAG: 2-dehydro-3-deoxyphosphooctonate aldolase [Xanthomonadales bacterium]|nr:2-dehydro-3-deoxyphosphooctonate aldolase [Xanthomonadales bacterium]
MSRFATQALFACALFAVSAFAAEEDVDWLFEPAPEPGSADPARLDPPPRFPSSDRSKSAWINQGDWLFDRLSGRGLRIGDPVHIRIFKQSRELELYLQGRDGFELYRTYPICDVSGMLGPKRFEGDLQAPEGFYTVVPERLHPHSEFHLAFNLGYPNEFDRSMGRTGSNIMIHGGCASNGCFAMTDYYMEQIYLLAEAALKNGQPEIGVEIYPFRMTEENLAAHAASRWIEFWRSLKPAHDHFAQSGLPAPIEPGVAGYRLPGHESLVEPGSIRVTAP